MKLKNILTVLLCFVITASLTSCSMLMGKKKQNGNAPGSQYYGQASDEQGSNVLAQGYGKEGSHFASNNPICHMADNVGGVRQHYFFDFNKNNIHPQYIDSLKTQADYLLSHRRTKIKLTGNTDDRGSREYNIALGWRRAKAVARVLEQYGVPKRNITLVSYGAEKPVMLGATEEDYQCNRRVDLIYLTG